MSKSACFTTNCEYGEWYIKINKRKISLQNELRKIVKNIDDRDVQFKRSLSEAICIKSIPSVEYWSEIYKMKSFVENWFNKLGIKNESFDIGTAMIDGELKHIPPVVLGKLKASPGKKTICVYLFLDVKEPHVEEWDTDPWTLTEKDGKYYGCGAASSKGIFLCWMHAIQSFISEHVEIPINIRFVIESAYTMNSPNLMKFLVAKKQDFFYDVDYIVCNITEWLGNKYPCICYGSVGNIYFTMTGQKVEGSKTDPEEDLKKIFATMGDECNRIIIPHFNDFVDQVTPDEERIYSSIRNFDLDSIRSSLPPHKQQWDKVRLLMSFWRQPSITIHQQQKCICEENDTTTVRQDFSITFVQRQIMEKCINMVHNHVKNKVRDLEIQNKIDVQLAAGVKHWIENINSKLYVAARRATIQIYKEEPDMVRDDKSRAIVTILKMVFEKQLLVLPIASKDCSKFKPNEFIHKKNYMEGTKLIAAFIIQLAETSK